VIRIGANISALQAQRRLGDATSTVATSYERLSSGQRINRASDDAAGLAVADRLRSDRRLYGVASRNINDGISALNIVDGTLDIQSGILQRLQELAEQSANGSFSSTQRETLDAEYQQLVAEFGRLGDSASFNGLRLLRGNRSDGVSRISIQADISGSANSIISVSAGDTARMSGTIDLSRVRDQDINGDGFVDNFDTDDIQGSFTLEELSSMFGGQIAIVDASNSAGSSNLVAVGVLRDQNGSGRFELIAFERNSNGEYTITAGSYTTYDNLWNGVPGTYSYDAAGVSSVSSFSATLSDGGSIQLDLSGLRFRTDQTASSIDFTGVGTVSQSRFALDTIEQRLSELGALRGIIGAAQSRLASALSLSSIGAEARATAESRVRDVDVASETAKLAQSKILQQAAVAVLAQANSQPRIALQLLGL
jgi:flagellin